MVRLTSCAFEEIAFSESVMLTQPFVHGKADSRKLSGDGGSQQVSTNPLRPYKAYSSLLTKLSDANINYSSLQASLTNCKRRITGTVSYTFSKALVDASSSAESMEDSYNRHFSYGPASFDRGHVLVATFMATERTAIGRAQSGQYHANVTGLNTDTMVTGFGSVTGSRPGRNLQLGLKLRF